MSAGPLPPLSSIMTIRPSPDPNAVPRAILPAANTVSTSTIDSFATVKHGRAGAIIADDPLANSNSIFSIASMDSYHTAHSSTISSTMATEGGSTIRSLNPGFVHRFTLHKPGGKLKRNSGTTSPRPTPTTTLGLGHSHQYQPDTTGWNPLDLFFSSGLLVSKCDLCTKRIGWKPMLECDDCGLRCAFQIIK